MRLLVINPNSTESMTQAVVSSAKSLAPGVGIEGWTSHEGPPSIQGAEDGIAASAPLLALIETAQNADAIIIACFDDTALAKAKALAPCPVIGIGEASYHAAALRGHRFSVVTTLEVSVPVIEANIAALGFSHLCGKVRASHIPVLELERDPKAAFDIITQGAKAAFEEDDVDCVILGCAGMTGLAAHLRGALERPIVDGVEAAVQLSIAMAGLDTTS